MVSLGLFRIDTTTHQWKPNVQLIGIDCAMKPKNVGIALVEMDWAESAARLGRVGPD